MSTNKSKKITGTLPGRTHEVGLGGRDAAAFARWYRDQEAARWQDLDIHATARLADAIVQAEAEDRTIFVMGNGGSAATASHIATDLSKTAAVPGRKQVRCVSLTDNIAFITAVGNDLSFDDIFSRQLENFLQPKDLVLLISGSGNSPNLIQAARYARSHGAATAALLGFDGGKLKDHVDIALLIPSNQYGVIEDLHLGVGHILTFFLKQRRMEKNAPTTQLRSPALR